ncbi:enolase C-terminal domain-like protein [Pontiella agarivorans]|uniref:Enolase C-terminal domain-like protein n=1 Tax=Pontiella agarivorans TaxID=3038953 RepID=A0ABU5MSF6_9BACT|nr:enolase C-terminal domain-like protein [Pontiella agarivorans]MDZ8117016.1 enolase C-terminal domain-like protein [Pontiella agarivorans]
MKITKIETWVCERPDNFFDSARTGRSPMRWDVVVLKLHTDTGLHGTCTFFGARSGRITEAMIHDIIVPVVLGRDPTDRETIWHEFWNIDRHGAFFPVFLPGPIDVALWDICAKAAGLPLHRYIGSYRTSLPVYASSLFLPSTEAYVEQALDYQKRGINAYKAHPPGPWRKDMEVHQALRDALGAEAVLMSDPVAEYTLEEAIRVGRHLEELNYHWFEEPFRDFELEKYRKLCNALDIPIATTETTRGGPWGVAQAIQQGAADIVRADVSWKGGITGTLKVCHLAEAHGLPCEIHTTTMGLMDMANLHVSCAVRNCEYFELFAPEDRFQFPMKDPLPVDKNGRINVPEGPGLGMDLDWDTVDNSAISYKSFI